jgi:hypothetical protein
MRPRTFAIASGIIVVLAIAYWLVSPLFITTVSTETSADLPNAGTGATRVSHGQFTDGAPGHHASGQVVLLGYDDGSYAIRFEDDFKVTNGPDLFVYFGKDGEYVSDARISDLKASTGGQNYLVPTNIDPRQFNEIWIWCRAFGVKFGSAKLEP